MHCASCAGTIEAAVLALAGVEEVRINAASSCATVRHDLSRSDAAAIIDAIELAGYRAEPDAAGNARFARRSESRLALWRFFVAAFCAMQVMMLASPAYFSAPGELADDQRRLLNVCSWILTLPVLAFSARQFFSAALSSITARRIGMDVPVALGIVVAFVASTAATFAPHGVVGDAVYFDSLTMFVSFLLGARLLELQMRHRAESQLEAATTLLPRRVARIDSSGNTEDVDLARLRRGDRVRVMPGEVFAADGKLVDGRTSVDESVMTGESRSVAREPGDPLMAGSRNLEAPVVMWVERLGPDTRYEAIGALMRAVRADKPRMLSEVDRWAGPFVWGVLSLAVLAGVAAWFVDPARAISISIAVLIVTCPCALSLAAPSALLTGASAMGRRGLLLRRIDAIESLARLRVVYLDKTGTLTECGAPRLEPAAGSANDGVAATELESIAASLAAWSSHPLARRIRDAYPTSDGAWHDVADRPGLGVEAIDAKGRRWRLGAPPAPGADQFPQGDCMQCFLCRDEELVARLVFDEVLRPDVSGSIDALKREGLSVRILSGDAPERVAHIARLLGIAEAVGGMTPEQKVAALRAAQSDGEIVGMVGDGINDGPVLAQADVSFAMADGAAIAHAEADGVLIFNRIGDIVIAGVLARKTLRIVRQNLAWAVVYNALCVPLAALGMMPPWIAGAGMAASSLGVVVNSLRLSRGVRAP